MRKIALLLLVAFMPGLADAARLSNPYNLNKHSNKSRIVVNQMKSAPVVKEETVSKPIAKKKFGKSEWYFGIFADMSFLSWKNEYEDNGVDVGKDTFNFKPVFGANLAFGYDFGNAWRTDLELGYLGTYSETETEDVSEKTDFTMTTFYSAINGYYSVWKGVYVGVGTGVAAVKVKVDDTLYGESSKQSWSPIGVATFGYRYKLNDNTKLDVRYRFMGYTGSKMKLKASGISLIDSEIGLITDNMLSAGISFTF